MDGRNILSSIRHRLPVNFNPWLLILLSLALLLVVVTRLHIPARLLDFVLVQRVVPEQGTPTDLLPAAILDELLRQYSHRFPRLPLVRAALLQPAEVKEIKPFWIDQCGVRQGDFYRFTQWQRIYPDRVMSERGQPPDWDYQSSNAGHRILGRLDIPANGVSYYDASAYCRTNNGRLPTLDEHQASTTGMNGALYPWGNQSDKSLWPYLDPMLNAVQQCGTQPQAATPEQQIQDLGHGMLEWVSLPPEQAALMGGGVEDKPHELYALNFISRAVTDKTERIKYAGFRCAYDQAPQSGKSLTAPWGASQELVMVPGGSYTLGPPARSKLVQLLKIIQPDEWATLSRLSRAKLEKSKEFQISRCEISRRQYSYFLIDPLVKLGFFSHRLQVEDWDYRPLNWEQQLTSPELPVVGIDWWSAYAFAQWVGGRLPSLEEWRTTASATGQSLYPWGNQDHAGKLQRFLAEKKSNQGLQICGNSPVDQTASGVNDMAGNVSEWILDIARLADGYGVTVAGGNYMLPASPAAKITQHSVIDPEYRSMALGFRVVLD